MKRLYHQKELSRWIGISESQIRYWDRIGLIPHREKQKGQLFFDFRGMVAFRAVKELRDQGVSLRRIDKCMQKLKKLLPDLEQPLAEARLVASRNQLVIAKGNRRLTPEGQLLLNFVASPLPGPIPLRPDQTEDLLFQALECEQERDWQEAEKKYLAVLAIEPDHLDALVNLGNIYHRDGALKEAAACYRRALRINPDHVEANYNLANLLAEQRDLDNAILFYRKAIHEDGEFADAYFNLGRTLEKAGDPQGAGACWRRYLELEPDSEWADYIRGRLDA